LPENFRPTLKTNPTLTDFQRHVSELEQERGFAEQDKKVFPRPNKKYLQAFFEKLYEMRRLCRNYSDGFDNRIPLQYRYLSFFQIIEDHFRSGGK
jgi:hypothetical protein